MNKKYVGLFFSACLLIGTVGCAAITSGSGSWEIYGGVRTKQDGDKPAKIEIQSSVVDKIVDSLTDGEVTDAE